MRKGKQRLREGGRGGAGREGWRERTETAQPAAGVEDEV